MSAIFVIDSFAERYMSEIFDEFARSYSMIDYVPAIYWAINRGVVDGNDRYILDNQGGYALVLAKSSDVADDDVIMLAQGKKFAVRLGPNEKPFTPLRISLIDEEIVIAQDN